MKQQSTTATPFAKKYSASSDEKDSTIIRQNSRLKNFFERLFSSSTQLTREDWEHFEFRRSPQSIRAQTRRNGIL